MAQKTSWTGAALTESDINTYLMGEGGAWTSWTPTVTQSGSVSVTNVRSRYGRWGRLIVATCSLTVTGTGTSSNAVTISLPVTAASSGFPAGGRGVVTDVSATLNYHGLPYLQSTSTFVLEPAAVGVGYGALGLVSFTAALASGDLIQATVIYEAAT